MNADQMKMACKALAVAIHDCGPNGTPSGHLYAAVMSQLSLSEYQECIDCLKYIGLVKESGHVLTYAKTFKK